VLVAPNIVAAIGVLVIMGSIVVGDRRIELIIGVSMPVIGGVAVLTKLIERLTTEFNGQDYA
jgi:hypothetical protein